MQTTEPNIKEFRQGLLHWWVDNARDFPWRENRSPYATAVAELMLRRTRAAQVVPVYNSFLTAYPTLAAAVSASPQDLKEILRPLGLEWRADNMVAFFDEAFSRFGEELPEDIITLRTLPGVGDYVGAAIACFAGGQNIALIDTNVVRVLGRVFGLNTAGEARRRRDMRELAVVTVDPVAPANYHYALLDFGAKVCVAVKPRCNVCPFAAAGQCDYYNLITKVPAAGDGTH